MKIETKSMIEFGKELLNNDEVQRIGLKIDEDLFTELWERFDRDFKRFQKLQE